MAMVESTGKTRPSRISVPGDPYLIAMLLSAFLIRLLIAWMPVETLIQKTLSDDAFYYFVIARNVAQGKGPTIDGSTLTNGFHPFWALLLIPLYAIFPGRDNLVIHLGLTVSAVFDVLTAWLAYITVRSLFKDTRAALAACFLYTFNPRVIMEAANGLETALSVFLLALSFYWYSKKLVRFHRPLTKDAFLLGGLAGLMVLARTDTVVMAALIGLDMFLQKRRIGLACLLAFGLSLTLVLTPWLLWNQLNFGTVVQSSGAAVPYLAQRHFPHLLRDRELFLMLWKYLIPGVLQISFLSAWHYSGVAWTVISVSLISLRLAKSRLPDDGPRENLALPRHLALPLAAALIVVLLHTLYRWYPRNWYYVPLAFSASLLAGPIFAKVSQTMTQASARGALFKTLMLGGSALLFLLQGAKEWNEGFYPWQIEMYRVSLHLHQHLPPQTVIGSFNAGLQAYYSGHTVVNLDGVTNWEAFEALRQRRLLAYMDERGISYIVDFDEYIRGIYSPFYGEGYPERLALVAALSAPRPGFGTIVLYKVGP